MRTKPDVLVLNKSFLPIHIIEWDRCMSLIIQESARPLDRDFVAYDFLDWLTFSEITDDYPVVGTVRYKIAVPEIIVLKTYNNLPIRDVKYSRQTLFQRDKFTCGYCNTLFDRRSLTVDHIVPRSQGGHSNWLNTVTCCKPCNYKKSNRTPEQAKMRLYAKIKKPMWISPLTGLKNTHPCKSWHRFMDRTLVDVG